MKKTAKSFSNPFAGKKKAPAAKMPAPSKAPMPKGGKKGAC